jgi:GNAT superfamily N-acetyltransferase
MVNHLVLSLKNILKIFKVDNLYYYLLANFYINKVAVTAEKDLSSLRPVKDSLEQAGLKLVEITSGALMRGQTVQNALIYSDEGRRRTAMGYLEKGYCGVALVRGKEVSGDIWYTSACNHKKGTVHPDLKWLRMECGDNDVYAFDMYVYPGKRGGNVANLLQNGALHEIRKNGYARAYGYYWAENIPALWVHRTLQWKELKRVKVTRFLWLQYSHES